MPFGLLTVKGNVVSDESADVENALKLLLGINRFSTIEDDQRQVRLDELKKTKFPSATTKPTEKEAMAALARVLTMDDPPKIVLMAVAALFDPGKRYAFGGDRRVVFKKVGKGHNDDSRQLAIANLMFDLCQHMSYAEAAEEAARVTGLGERQVKRIYGVHKDLIEASREALKTTVTPDAPSVDMTSNKRT